MIKTEILMQGINKEIDDAPFQWVDLCSPTKEELFSFASCAHLPPTLITDSLSPRHLPKYEIVGDTVFILVRAYDDNASPDYDTIHTMTVKLALFWNGRQLITIHRNEQKFITSIMKKYQCHSSLSHLQGLILELINAATETFRPHLDQMEFDIEQFENSILYHTLHSVKWKSVFKTKSRLTTIKRLLWHSLSIMQQFNSHFDKDRTLCQDMKEKVENFYVSTDLMAEDLGGLLNLQLSLSSNRTNGAVRIMTVFSVFFLPLNFIVGFYGMNFKWMPLTDWNYGPYFIIFVMLGTTCASYAWFKKRKWL